MKKNGLDKEEEEGKGPTSSTNAQQPTSPQNTKFEQERLMQEPQSP